MGRANISLQPTALRSVASLPRSALRLSSVPLAGQRPLPRLVGRKATSCANIILSNPAAGELGRRTIVAADPAARGRRPGWRPGGAMAAGDGPARGG